MFSPKLFILSVILGLGLSSPTLWTRQQQEQLNLLNWTKQQNQLYASGKILGSSGGASSASSELSEWQKAYLKQLQLLAQVAENHQKFINGQTPAELEVENEEMLVQDAEDESEEDIPDEDSTETTPEVEVAWGNGVSVRIRG